MARTAPQQEEENGQAAVEAARRVDGVEEAGAAAVEAALSGQEEPVSAASLVAPPPNPSAPAAPLVHTNRLAALLNDLEIKKVAARVQEDDLVATMKILEDDYIFQVAEENRLHLQALKDLQASHEERLRRMDQSQSRTMQRYQVRLDDVRRETGHLDSAIGGIARREERQ